MSRNRTLTLSEEERSSLIKEVKTIESLKENFQDNMIINGDIFSCLEYIPNNYFDLIILDPPYNLDKDFHGRKFTSMKSEEYENYLRSWFGLVCDKLRELYTCCPQLSFKCKYKFFFQKTKNICKKNQVFLDFFRITYYL